MILPMSRDAVLRAFAAFAVCCHTPPFARVAFDAAHYHMMMPHAMCHERVRCSAYGRRAPPRAARGDWLIL